MTREEEWYVSFYHWWNHYIALPHIFSLVCHSKHWKLTKALYKIKPTSEYYYYTLIYSKLTWKIKLIFTLLIRCKFMCCSQHFTTYLLSLQNILFFDWHRASYIILLIYMLNWNSLVYASRLMTSPGCHSEKLSGFHVCIFQLILLKKMQFFFGSTWLLDCS